MKTLLQRARPAIAGLLLAGAALAGLSLFSPSGQAQGPKADGTQATSPPPAGLAVATFAGGCFWCMEPPFDKLDGVVSTTSGYTGGKTTQPSYREVSAGITGHTEAVQVVYDPKKISYDKLLDVFWHNIDPTVRDQQFCDHGNQYRTGIFVHGADQRRAAEASRTALAANKPFAAPVVTEIADAGVFWAAEDYHQDYYLKNPIRYKYYRNGCGRDARLKELWGDKAGGAH